MKHLAPVLRDLLQRRQPAVLVTIADARGSTPRELGARMLVTADRIFGSIGGGRLEYDAMQEARALLGEPGAHAINDVPLGPALGQCCGGHATVLLEQVDAAALEWIEALDAGRPGVLLTPLHAPAQRLLTSADGVLPASLPGALSSAARQALETGAPARWRTEDGEDWLVEPTARDRPQVILFGAGHVGRALAQALAPLPCAVRWIDSRAELFAEPAPDGVQVVLTQHPRDQVGEAEPGTFFLVMTHSHDLDCAICEAILRRGDFAWLGLIGSQSKRARFERRWRAHGIPEERIGRLVCPIGLPEIAGKEPVVIAASTAAQLLMAFEEQVAPASRARTEPALSEA